MREPAFWWREAGLFSTVLSPFSALYGAIAAARMAQAGERAPIPVICIGNFTLGGSGKTPAAIAIASMLADAGHKPAILTRGYGGTVPGPMQVDPFVHNGATVGDEALLLARAAQTIVARDRVAGAKRAATDGAAVVVMDDGMQNTSLAKDFTIVVVDGPRGTGNGRVFPAGPLRAPMTAQWPRTGALLMVGKESGSAQLIGEATARHLPVIYARLDPDPAAVAAMKGRKALAFAGIGNPEKFFSTLEAAGIDAPVRRAFADHHTYSSEEAASLVMQAGHEGLELLTTEKDIARIAGVPGLAALASRARALPVTLTIEDKQALLDLLLAAVKR